MQGPDGGEARGWPCARGRDVQHASWSAGGRRMGVWRSGGKKRGNVPRARGADGVSVREDFMARR
jgi:hypothetical protein